MILKTTEYKEKYRGQCVRLMRDTWNFDKYFTGLKVENLINEIFFEAAALDANYSEVIVDEQENVYGYIFGKIGTKAGRLRNALGTLKFTFRVLRHYFAGHLGPKREADSILLRVKEMEKTLNSEREKTDGYVNLFFVGSSMRGTGWGRKLMNRYEKSARENDCRRLYLWTDQGCNYGFYDHYGFSRIKEITSPLLEDNGGAPNGFTYVKMIS